MLLQVLQLRQLLALMLVGPPMRMLCILLLPAAQSHVEDIVGRRLWPFIHRSGGPLRCCCARDRCLRTSCFAFGNQDYRSLEGYRREGMPAPPVSTVGMLGLLLLLQVRHLQKVVAQLLHSQHPPRRPQVRTCRSRERGLTDECSSSGYLDKGNITKYQSILMVVQCEMVDVLTSYFVHSLKTGTFDGKLGIVYFPCAKFDLNSTFNHAARYIPLNARLQP